MQVRRTSFVSPQLLMGIVAPVIGTLTATALGWPSGLKVTSAVVAMGLVGLAIGRHTLGRLLRPFFGDKLEHFLADEHAPRTQQVCTSAILAATGASLLWLALGGGQWAFAGLTMALGALGYYWGLKVCPFNRSPKRAAAGIGLGAYVLSLSVNFIAGAMTGQTSLDSSANELSAKVEAVLGLSRAIKEDTTAIRKQQSEQAAHTRTLTEKMERLERYLADKPLTDNPQDRDIPEDVLLTARELMDSTDTMARAAAAIVLKDWDAWAREITTLNAMSPTEHVFKSKMLEGDGYFAQGLFDDAIGPFEVAFRLRETNAEARNNLASALSMASRGDRTARNRRAIEICEETLTLPELTRHERVAAENLLGNAWGELPIGNRMEYLNHAIAAYHRALSLLNRDADPVAWAATQLNLGRAWFNTPTENQEETSARALAAFEAALQAISREEQPLLWAQAKTELGSVWLMMPTGDHAGNLANAMAAYNEALAINTRDAQPLNWAKIQVNLGEVWRKMPNGDSEHNLRQALAAQENALTVLSRESTPIDWSRTQNNIGLVWLALPSLHPGDNFTKAIAAFTFALEACSREQEPALWATIQSNLAVALTQMPLGDRHDNLQKALAAYEAVLTVFTRDTSPQEWALAQNNMGFVWFTGPTDDRDADLRMAIRAFDLALTVWTRETTPAMWAMAQQSLGVTYYTLVSGDRTANLRRSIVACEQALTACDRTTMPEEWATLHYHLANAVWDLSTQEGENGCGLKRRAIASIKGAIDALDENSHQSLSGTCTAKLLAFGWGYGTAGCSLGSEGVPFKDIPAAK